MPFVHRIVTHLRDDPLLLGLLLVLPLLIVLSPTAPSAIPGLVHWQTLATLAGLMALSRALESSGYLILAGTLLLQRAGSERMLGAALVLFAAALAAVVTNDVALFIVIPLTLGLRRVADLPIGRLIILEALAVNAGSALSPVGNPQNLYLWQASNAGFLEFTLAMLPLGLGLLVIVLALVPLALSAKTVSATAIKQPVRLERALLWLTLPAYPLFLLAAEAGWALPAAGLVAALLLLFRPALLRDLDWGLLLVFILMFINLGLLARLPAVAAQAEHLDALPGGLFSAAALLSQVISNVPAAIFLAEFSADWRLLAWGANVGGFGLAIGSLANLIALRLAREPGLWIRFHYWSLPVLLLSWLFGMGLLRMWG
ncbi:MAG: transporter [Gammaproteobacteria bacterium]|nr:MAG: transporter [Gammaproteobacteria bacterium]